MTEKVDSPFVSAAELAARLASSDQPSIIFVSGEATLPDELIPGSISSEPATHFAGTGGGERGKLPLPEASAVRAWLAGLGIGEGRGIVVYDAGNGGHAARAWWVLRWAGHHAVRILDGGLAAWLKRPQAATPPASHAVATLSPQELFKSIDTARLADDLSAFKLVDARSKAAFDGDGTKPSHLPGALSSPSTQWQDKDGYLLPLSVREAKARQLGLLDGERPVVAYCGSGVAAAYLIAATQDLGVDATLYVGSWSAWSADPQRLAAAVDPS
jgi:thiosulfate/3-mercaptopyruvate sulfurtransferase